MAQVVTPTAVLYPEIEQPLFEVGFIRSPVWGKCVFCGLDCDTVSLDFEEFLHMGLCSDVVWRDFFDEFRASMKELGIEVEWEEEEDDDEGLDRHALGAYEQLSQGTAGLH